ncbi:MAG: WecB/TagA/CpsF family glycosyltransferase [Candidatus Methylacidiphilales bacterium]|nr:WecB/TagA/CpsF family glycosyltransferase [Candidatus Methylacidiphilales bacterium]
MEQTLDWIAAAVRERTPRFIATANVDFAAQASRDVELQRLLLSADLVLCDGTPLVWASRWMNAPLPERVPGSDLVPRICEKAEELGWRLYFLGASDEVLGEARRRLLEKHPRLQIAGMESPPYKPLNEFDHAGINRRIREARADILLVAFGCPKQEKWIGMNLQEHGAAVSIGIGATFDFLAGKFSRAPGWAGALGIEWLYRMAQEPRRLGGRYLFDLFFFANDVRNQRRHLSPKPRAPATPVSSRPDGWASLVWNGRADAVSAGQLPVRLPHGRSRVVLDLSGVPFMDSTGMGRVVSLFKAATETGVTLAVLAPGQPGDLLRSMRFDRMFPIVSSPAELPAAPSESSVRNGNILTLSWQEELRALNSEAFYGWVLEQWALAPEARGLSLDLSQCPFMDSTGLGALLRCLKMVSRRPGAAFRIASAHASVRNVIHLARLERVLDLPAG